MVREGKKEQTLYAALNQQMESAILDSKNSPTMDTVSTHNSHIYLQSPAMCTQ